MNLTKLFEAQKNLRERINYNGEDRFEKLILALLVEIGECANEWRGFKFWSKDQEPNELKYDDHVDCWYDKKGKPHKEYKNSLLEEYVDCLHFILELGIERKFDVTSDFSSINDFSIGLCTETDTTWQFIRIHQSAMNFWEDDEIDDYVDMFLYFIGLSKHLRFTWEEVEKAYFSKNQINHERQNNGY